MFVLHVRRPELYTWRYVNVKTFTIFCWPSDDLLVDEDSLRLLHQTTQKLSSLRAKISEGSQDPMKCCVTLLIKESPGTSSLKGLPGGEVSGSA